MQRKPIVLSFFSGAMGLDLGLEQAGLETRLVCEIDKASRATIQINRPDLPLLGDIRAHDPISVRQAAKLQPDDDIDVVVGGPPCQAFSTAGGRKGFEDERGNVFLNFIDLIIGLTPRYAVIENVRGLLSAPLIHRPHNQRGPSDPPLSVDEMPGGALSRIIAKLESAGFGVSFNLYNAANFGVPQKRERLIIIASRSGRKLPFLKKTHDKEGLNGLAQWQTFAQATHGMDNAPHSHIQFPEKRLKYYRLIKAGQNWRHLPDELKAEAMGGAFHAQGGKSGFYRRLAWDQPAPTLVTNPAMPATDLCHPTELRPLSVEEYKRLQQFPDSWQIAGSIFDQYRQVGNAVPVGLGRAIGELIVADMNGDFEEQTAPTDFSRYRNTDLDSWRRSVLIHETARSSQLL